MPTSNLLFRFLSCQLNFLPFRGSHGGWKLLTVIAIASILAVGASSWVVAQTPTSFRQEVAPAEQAAPGASSSAASQNQRPPSGPSKEILTVGAYLVIWVLVGGYLIFIHQRMNAVRRQVAWLNQQLEDETHSNTPPEDS